MRKIIVTTMMSLDGVMQAPGGPEEDTSGGFTCGGWSVPYRDKVGGAILKKQMQPADYLLGRKTFQNFEAFWPGHGELWPGINDGAKYVLSRTVRHSEWANSFFLQGLADIETLKSSEGMDLQVWGSGQLVQLLLKNDLVDELWLRIYPLILGQGKRLFAGDIVPRRFELVETLGTPSGLIVATYKRRGEDNAGSKEA